MKEKAGSRTSDHVKERRPRFRNEAVSFRKIVHDPRLSNSPWIAGFRSSKPHSVSAQAAQALYSFRAACRQDPTLGGGGWRSNKSLRAAPGSCFKSSMPPIPTLPPDELLADLFFPLSIST